jgi:cell wall-associated NlpC family hydrolase
MGHDVRVNAKKVRRATAAALLVAAVIAVPARADGDSSATLLTDATDLPPVPLGGATPEADVAPPQSTVSVALDAEASTADAGVLTRADAKALRAKDLRARIVSLAKDQIGDKYRAGAVGPNAFDCSGLVRYVYRQVIGRELPHYSAAQYRAMRNIKLKDARPGDLIFFFRGSAHHVGIYIGDGKFIHAPRSGSEVRIEDMRQAYWDRRFTGARRADLNIPAAPGRPERTTTAQR